MRGPFASSVLFAGVLLAGLLFAPCASAQLDVARKAAPRHPQPTPLDASTTVFAGVSVIPMDRDTALAGRDVVVRGGKIASVSLARKSARPRGARVIDGRGKFLLPALADMHIHLRYLSQARDNRAMLRLFLGNGVTTVLNLLGLPEHLAMRDSIARGTLLGPDLWTSGFYVNPPFVRTPAEVDSAVRAQRAAGYDFVKIHADLSDSAYHRVMSVAREVEMPVVGHGQRRAGLDVSLAEHQPIAHLEEYLYAYFAHSVAAISADTYRALLRDASSKTARGGTPVITSLAVFCGIAGQVRNLDSVLARPEVARLPRGILREWLPGANQYTPARFPNVEAMENQCILLQLLAKQMQEDGVLLVAGTDTPLPATVPGYSLHDELRVLVDGGLTPYQALCTATVNAAEFLGEPGAFGQVTVGSRADLMLVDSDPRRDIGALRRRVGVMIRGRWMDAKGLERLMDGGP